MHRNTWVTTHRSPIWATSNSTENPSGSSGRTAVRSRRRRRRTSSAAGGRGPTWAAPSPRRRSPPGARGPPVRPSRSRYRRRAAASGVPAPCGGPVVRNVLMIWAQPRPKSIESAPSAWHCTTYRVCGPNRTKASTRHGGRPSLRRADHRVAERRQRPGAHVVDGARERRAQLLRDVLRDERRLPPCGPRRCPGRLRGRRTRRRPGSGRCRARRSTLAWPCGGWAATTRVMFCQFCRVVERHPVGVERAGPALHDRPEHSGRPDREGRELRRHHDRRGGDRRGWRRVELRGRDRDTEGGADQQAEDRPAGEGLDPGWHQGLERRPFAGGIGQRRRRRSVRPPSGRGEVSGSGEPGRSASNSGDRSSSSLSVPGRDRIDRSDVGDLVLVWNRMDALARLLGTFSGFSLEMAASP